MPHSRITSEEIQRRGETLYNERLRKVVETEENIGRLVAIDVETGDYEVGEDLLAIARRLQSRHPDAALWTQRIGYNAVYAVGGSLVRTTR
jgi:hypothetical protein